MATIHLQCLAFFLISTLVHTSSQLPSWTMGDTTATLYCNTQGECSNYNITCPLTASDEECKIQASSIESCQTSLVNPWNNNFSCDFTLTCNSQRSCQESTVNCPNNGEFCSIDCIGTESCQFGSINSFEAIDSNLLESTYMEVFCRGQYACQYSSIYCSQHGNCSISCSTLQACQYATINDISDGLITSTSNAIKTNNENDNIWFDLTCSNVDSCSEADIYCLYESSACQISCDGDDSCALSNVYCNDADDCNIDCDGNYACENANIYCSESSGSCSIDCTNQENHCSGLTVYCYESHELFESGAENSFCNIKNCVESDSFSCNATWIPSDGSDGSGTSETTDTNTNSNTDTQTDTATDTNTNSNSKSNSDTNTETNTNTDMTETETTGNTETEINSNGNGSESTGEETRETESSDSTSRTLTADNESGDSGAIGRNETAQSSDGNGATIG